VEFSFCGVDSRISSFDGEGKQRKERADGAVLKNFHSALMHDLEFQIVQCFSATGVKDWNRNENCGNV